MKSPLSTLLITVMLLLCSLAYGQDTTAPKGKFSGLMFGDYFYNISNKTAANKDLNGFQFRRIYFTYDYAIATDFDTRFRLEADQAALTSNGKIGVLVKDAWLKWKNVFHNSDLTFGLSPTPAFEISEDAWGYRSLEKTIMDLQGIVPARDIAVDLRGKIVDDGTVNYWVKIGNNSSTSPEADKYKRYYGLLHFKPTTGFQATAYADFDAQPKVRDTILNDNVSNSKVTLAGFLNYRVPNLYSLGLEGFYRTWQNNSLTAGAARETQNTYGISAFAWYGVSPTFRVVGRVDYFDPNSSAENDANTLFIASLDYLPTPEVHIMPNLEYVKYQASGVDSDAAARVTVFYLFH